MAALASTRCGRILLHVIAMIADRAYRFHLAGIVREFH